LISVILVLLSYLILSQPVRAVIASVMLAWFGIAALLGAEGTDERLRKLIAAGLIIAILGVAFGGYALALFHYARTTYFWSDIASFPVACAQQSFLISDSPVGGPVVWVACPGG